MLLIQAASIDHAYGGHDVLRGATFEIRDGDRLALIGANGSGKSTLFRLMAGRLQPQRGTLSIARGVRVGFLSQEPEFDPAQTVREAIALAAGDPAALEARAMDLERQMGEAADDDALTAIVDAYTETLARLDQGSDPAKGTLVLAGLGLAESLWDRRIGDLSGGEKKLVGLARLLTEEPDVLLLDEPDNHLDFAGKVWLEGYICQHHGAVAVISHDRYFIDRAINQICELEDGRITGYPGNYSVYRETKQSKLERDSQLRELQEREFRKLKASAEQLTQWARQNPKFASRAENMRRKLAEERERLAQTPTPILNPRQIDVAFTAERGSTIALEAKGLAKSFAARTVLLPFDLEIRHGDAVGIVGANGSGKTTLFRMLLGQETSTAGAVRIGPSTVVGYYAQEQETLDPLQTPLDLVRGLQPLSEQAAIGVLTRYLFTRDDMLNRIGNLSGGQRARLQIAALILRGANLLLLDEPTNNLDIASVERLEEALLAFLDEGRGSILTISHDRAFLDTICQRIVAIDSGIVREYAGGFTWYDTHRGEGRELTIREREPVRRQDGKASRQDGKTARTKNKETR
ncbi:MAG: ABC-F family ATP-binding cassette domain-containing protein [Thermomicrobiales bacterium]